MPDQFLDGNPLVSIISINYNQLEVSCEMLDSIRRQDFRNIEVIIVDNASSIDPSPILEERYPEVKLIRSEKNLGFAGGNNLGIQAAKGDFLFLVNNDTELTKGLIASLVKRFQAVTDLGIVSPLICYEKDANKKDIIQYAGATPVSTWTGRNTIRGEGEEDQGQYDQPGGTAYAHGAAMMISRDTLKRVGAMPELFFLYYEELDWCEQIRRAGLRIQVEPRVRIYHKESVSTGKSSPMKTFYLTRNRLLFMRRNRNLLQITAFFIFFVSVTMPRWLITFAVKGEWSQFIAFSKAVLWHLSQKELTFVNRSGDGADPVSSPKNSANSHIQSRA